MIARFSRRGGGELAGKISRELVLLAGFVGPANLAEDVAKLLVRDRRLTSGAACLGDQCDLVKPVECRVEQSLAQIASRGRFSQLILHPED